MTGYVQGLKIALLIVSGFIGIFGLYAVIVWFLPRTVYCEWCGCERGDNPESCAVCQAQLDEWRKQK